MGYNVQYSRKMCANKYANMTRLRETKSYWNTKKNAIMARTDFIIQ